MNIPIEYKNLSTIAKASGKRLGSWIDRSVGKDALAEFQLKHPEIDSPLITKKGRGGGTWAHPELAAVFAAWCNPQFTAEVIEQNAQLREQNELLKEKIRTFQVDTPAQIAAAMDEVVEVKKMAHQAEDKGIEEVELLAKCFYVRAIPQHPKGLTFEQYLPHWLYSMNDRPDICPREVLEEMTKKAGKPIPYQGKVLKHGYSYVWVDA
jgi:KilA-N domain